MMKVQLPKMSKSLLCFLACIPLTMVEAGNMTNCETSQCGEFSFGISAVNAGGLNNIPIAVRENQLDEDGWEGKLYTPDLNWNPAWEVNFTKDLCGGGAFGVHYWGTYFDKSSSLTSEDEDLHLIFSGGENDGTDLAKVTTNVKLNVSKISVLFQDLLTQSCNSCIHWYGGLTYYHINSTVRARGFDEDDSLEHFTKNEDTNNLIGPTTGFLFSYSCNNCYDLYLNSNVTLAYNSHKIERKEGPAEDLDAPMDFYYCYGTVVPVVDSAIGIKFSKCNWDFSIEYGFKWFYRLFDSVMQLDDTNEASGVSTPYDVTFNGVTLRAGRSF
ncbi:MAG: Lpg1974 family pore-forming outer membrane protein [Chlamydiota bacterium]